MSSLINAIVLYSLIALPYHRNPLGTTDFARLVTPFPPGSKRTNWCTQTLRRSSTSLSSGLLQQAVLELVYIEIAMYNWWPLTKGILHLPAWQALPSRGRTESEKGMRMETVVFFSLDTFCVWECETASSSELKVIEWKRDRQMGRYPCQTGQHPRPYNKASCLLQ